MSVLQFFQSLRQGLAETATVKNVFGDPVVVGNRTVIPVARVSYGFGGGLGSGRAPGSQSSGATGEGGGGGGGVSATPIGVIEITPERTQLIAFRPLGRLVAAVAVGVVLGMWMARRRRK